MDFGHVETTLLLTCQEPAHIRGQIVDSGDISNRTYHLFESGMEIRWNTLNIEDIHFRWRRRQVRLEHVSKIQASTSYLIETDHPLITPESQTGKASRINQRHARPEGI